MLGLLVAFLGVALSDYLQIPMLDGVASIVIGCILGLTAVLLAYESKGLLIGEAVSPVLVAGVKSIRLIHEAQQGCRDATYEPSRTVQLPPTSL